MKQVRLFLVCAAIGMASCSDATSPEEYVELVEASRDCSADDQCVVAGGSGCTCPAPINASNKDAVIEAAGQVECNGATVECSTHTNVRCEDGRCVTDESP